MDAVNKKCSINYSWCDPEDINFVPRKIIPEQSAVCVPLISCNRFSTELDVFLKLMPRNFVIFILRQNSKNKIIQQTDPSELMIVLGCMLVMTYNRLPEMHDYWASNKSLGNAAIKSAISRDIFLLLHSKLYFNYPEKLKDANKIYYIEELVSCLKHTFQKSRTESTHQSIDESMTKFKGRSSLKQYLPLKPIKREIKIWQRCDSVSGYVYDFNIYQRRESDAMADKPLCEPRRCVPPM
ncbi:piggyBac transposable element-derived protein 4-like [Sitophilus oryzae]|uniref:PiggyBac transposable element-derived protein 4-like n=1 Tax=Sitophilus oryzae TaxID=7048 RepID=A0A6J2XKV8_SITOR|nr:piggyBac transposable element-derived protein 4-like [Sitophilus oryzae]